MSRHKKRNTWPFSSFKQLMRKFIGYRIHMSTSLNKSGFFISMKEKI